MMQNVRRTGFTLVELLVVIAVIGILVGVLLPALSSARKTAKQVKGMTHLKQLGLGWHVYSDQNDDISLPGRFGTLPGGTSNPDNFYSVGNGEKYRPRWIAVLAGYTATPAFDNPDPMNDRQDYDAEICVCPTVPERTDERNSAYGYNHQFLGNPRFRADGRFRNYPVKRSWIRQYAGTVMAGDCMGTAAGVADIDRTGYINDMNDETAVGNHGWTLDPPRLEPNSDHGSGDPSSPRTGIDPRHQGRGNVVFLDGHAELLTPEELGYRKGADGAYVDDFKGEEGPTNQMFSGDSSDDAPPA